MNSHAEPLEPRRLLASPQLDLTFGEGGVAPIPKSSGEFFVLKALPSGKILAAGEATVDSSAAVGQDDPIIARFNPDGTLDTSFDQDGILYVPQTDGSSGAARAAAVAPDGKIFVAYKAELEKGLFKIYRFNADGTADTTFGAGGVVSQSVHRLWSIRSIAIQSDNKILLAIVVGFASEQQIPYLLRLNADGSIDNSFRGGLTSGIPTNGALAELLVAPDNKIYAVQGSSIARYNPDGALDTTFGGDGFSKILPTKFPGTAEFHKLALDNAGRLLVASQYNVDSVQSISLSRFTTTGAHDTTFSSDGFIDLHASNKGPTPTAALVSPDGKITVGVSHSNQGLLQLYRLDSSGNLDPTFGMNGKLESQRDIFQPNLIAFDADGNILAAGDSPALALARFVPDSPEISLSKTGRLTVNGTDDADTISLSQKGNQLIVNRNGKTTRFPLAGVKQLLVPPSAGGDTITVSIPLDCSIGGGTGNDTITLAGGDMTLSGGTGNDKIVCGIGGHQIDLGKGNDRLTTGRGRDTITAGDGNDTIRTGAYKDVIDAGNGDDSISTGSGADLILTASGNDTVNAGAGNDRVLDYYDYPDDELPNHSVGKATGNKLYLGGDGNDSLLASSGNDSLYGNGGRDSLYGNAGNDYLNGGGGNDYIDAARYPDNISPNATDINTLLGGEGDDTLIPGSENDLLSGGPGKNQISR